MCGNSTEISEVLNKRDSQHLIRMFLNQMQINKDDFKFERGNFGKPYLLESVIFFNLSYSDNYIAVVFSRQEVGIDIEEISNCKFKIMDRFFTSNEQSYIKNSNNLNMTNQRFYEIWTRKEAFIKRDGRGLNIPLRSFDVLINENVPYFNTIFYNNHIISICVDKKEEYEIHNLQLDKLDMFECCINN